MSLHDDRDHTLKDEAAEKRYEQPVASLSLFTGLLPDPIESPSKDGRSANEAADGR